MKVLQIGQTRPATKQKANLAEVLEAIHLCAMFNGSKCRIKLVVEGDVIYCNSTYSNSEYSKGYYAVLYLIDELEDANIVYTNPGNACWFRIRVGDPAKVIEYLTY